jgi:hypothetical protein
LVDSWPSRPSASRPIPPAQWPLARNHYPGSSRAVLARRWRPRRCTWSALINPAGSDPGHEAVVIGNCATTSQSLHGWQLIDRNGRVTKLDAEIPGGASTIVVLDGTGVQLGNNGGNLVLQGELAHQVDSVTSSAKDAAAVDRYIRFQQ